MMEPYQRLIAEKLCIFAVSETVFKPPACMVQVHMGHDDIVDVVRFVAKPLVREFLGQSNSNDLMGHVGKIP